MKTALIFSLFILLVLTGCTNGDMPLIKKDLDSRFTKFEIVETKKDSANVYDAFNHLLSLRVYVSSCNLEITKAISKYYGIDGKWSKSKVIQYVDSINSQMTNAYERFEALKYSKTELCYYVKYRIYDGANKIEKEEYFDVRKYGNKKEVIHRPYDWTDYLIQENYSDLVEKGLNYYKDYLDVKYDR